VRWDRTAGAPPRPRGVRRAGMEGRSDHGMKTHEEDEAAGRSCALLSRNRSCYREPNFLVLI
jgi:hypothetical protein